MQDEPATSLSHGLTQLEFEASLETWGLNEIRTTPPSLLKLFVMQFIGPMQAVLLVCAILSAVFGDNADFGIILGPILAKLLLNDNPGLEGNLTDLEPCKGLKTLQIGYTLIKG